MRVITNRALCEGHSVCESLVPEVFEVGEDDRVHLLTEQVEGAVADRVRTAVGRCPKQALSVASD
ncbi:ferredoxin [Sphaerimonospora mesophila]|uniref:ferredoxin n=1 Tax=Sphaerimonospora mesophila TaxID=37483 RepID=UPI0006E46DEB